MLNGDDLNSRAVPARGAAASEASAALHRFLAGFGIGKTARLMLVEQLLKAARDQHRDRPDLSLADCAILHAEERFEAWLQGVLGPGLAVGQPALPAGRAAFLACGGPGAWPDLILIPDLPAIFVNAMLAALPPLSPLPAPATMPEQALESWSIVAAVRDALQLLGGSSGWAVHARPLVTASIKRAKSWS